MQVESDQLDIVKGGLFLKPWQGICLFIHYNGSCLLVAQIYHLKGNRDISNDLVLVMTVIQQNSIVNQLSLVVCKISRVEIADKNILIPALFFLYHIAHSQTVSLTLAESGCIGQMKTHLNTVLINVFITLCVSRKNWEQSNLNH